MCQYRKSILILLSLPVLIMSLTACDNNVSSQGFSNESPPNQEQSSQNTLTQGSSGQVAPKQASSNTDIRVEGANVFSSHDPQLESIVKSYWNTFLTKAILTS
jgi:hypothetical protein